MTVQELIDRLQEIKDKNKIIGISNVLNTPFATHSIKEVVEDILGPVYIRAKRND